MARNPIPALALTGKNKPERQGDTNQAIELWAHTVSPRIYAVDTPIVGTISGKLIPPSDAFLLIAGLQAVVFSAGLGTLTLPKPFPNGWLSLELTNANTNWLGFVVAGATLDAISVTCENAAGSVTGTQTVSYEAIGW